MCRHEQVLPGGKGFPLLLVRAALVPRPPGGGCAASRWPPCRWNAGMAPHPNQPWMPALDLPALTVSLGLQERDHFCQTLGSHQDLSVCCTS